MEGLREKLLSLQLPLSTRLEISLSSKTLTLALTMPWCPHCSDDGPTADAAAKLKSSPAGESTKRRFTSCSACGRVLKDRPFTSLDKTLSFINDIAAALAGDESSAIITTAQDLLRMAVDKDSSLFAGGGRRRRRHVAAACVYAVLRRHHKPYMLVDLSNSSKVDNFYALGAVFVALSKITLRLNEPRSPLIDPSLFMHRISTRLLGEKDAEVAAAALRILSGTRKPRDWMLSRGNEAAIKLCGAALYIAAAARGQGREFSKSEVFTAVGVEFERGSWDKLTMEEFVSRAAEMSNCNYFGSDELVCKHKQSYDRAHYCYGLCRECCDVFEELQQNRKRDKTEEEEEDGDDINVYLNTEREKNYKTIVWELMNKNYIEEQASEMKIRKERKRRREGDIDMGANATKGKVKEQRLSSRINYDALSQFYETDINGVSNEHGNEEENKELEDYNGEEEEVYGDDKSAEDQGYEDFGDLGEDYGEGNCNEFDEFEF